jgi:L-threonylcarbamoyladenylate synthase
VGLRFPAAAIPQAIIGALRGPITGTSANRSGHPACRSAAEAVSALGSDLPLILDGGPSPLAVPSTVVRIAGDEWELIREGAIPQADLESFFRSVG